MTVEVTPVIARAAAVLLLAGAALMTAAAPASAHAELTSSTPSNGAQLTAAPTQVTLTFNEPVTDPVLTASDDQGGSVALGAPTVSGSTITASWPASAASGLYRVSWTVTSDDGDPIEGVLLFAVAGPSPSDSARPSSSSSPPSSPAATSPTASTSPLAPTSTGSSVPWLAIGGAAVVVIAVAVALVARRGTRSGGAGGSEPPSAPEA